MSKKRKREVDLELVTVYEHLADDVESVRLKAAHTLVSKIFKPGVTNNEQTRTILTRLFRGLCSGRKAARLGFSVALTELLSQLSSTLEADSEDALTASGILDILETQTVPESGTSGQDERDHYFGRVFGADAVFKSGLLLKNPDLSVWKRLLDLICGVATRKPWLRQECGWILVNGLVSTRVNLPDEFVVAIIEKMAEHKLVRTPEGVAVWLTAERLFPNAKLPKSVWKHGDPLAKKDVDVLADILKDARSHSDQDTELEAQGSARWSANLHFAWDIVSNELFRDDAKSNKHRISFELFWDTVVDKSLFSPSSSTERKAWGFAVWRKVFESAPQAVLQHTFTPQATRCFVNSLKSPERFLQRHAMRLSQIFHTRLSPSDLKRPSHGLTGACIKALLDSVSYGDFDQLTKSKTLQSVLDVNDPKVLEAAFLTLHALLLLDSPPEEDQKAVLMRQKTLIGLEFKIVATLLRRSEQKAKTDIPVDPDDEGTELAKLILDGWAVEVTRPDLSTKPESVFKASILPGAREFMKERLALAFEQALRLGRVGADIFHHAVLSIYQLEKKGKSEASMFEDDIRNIVQQGWHKLTSMPTTFTTSKQHPVKKSAERERRKSGDVAKDSAVESFPTFADGLCLLYSLALFQIYLGETDAVEILQDLLQQQQQPDSIDAIVEIILSFSSKPSKFLRRISIEIFDAFAPHITAQGLESLCRVLETKENVEGQQEMFQAEDVVMEDGTSPDSDSDEMDSDVEVESIAQEDASEGTSSSAESNDETADDESEEGEDDDEDEELAKFDAALASALGTRRLDQNDVAAASDSSDSSDSDMDDDEMMELDSKLAEVFRARNEEQNKNKKKAAKDAKENVVNFKNRVLDLIESYLKHQQQNPLTVDLILPLLTLMRTTRTKQLADRTYAILQLFCSRAKGFINVPDLSTESQVAHALDILRAVHVEAAKESSNVHSNAASQTSILLVKALVKANKSHVKDVVDIYASTRVKQLTDKRCHISPGLFTDWNNLCQAAREKLAN
ncbi:hypothetical protein A1O1_05858 [Capronia coronata CBS 617.96]|uniref:DNA polymerase phi subunit n=1 Tax=Capronia coronata CBS 617.96 TaxID=1182541 RepID=W9YT86_9EURO|nr:uncharacterized protein A1O1_05858 [Capronia coronata CBS 617.96]EXJ85494.1 hypothetical protein A1O1_05858 [Capronia coronata CBS 617.96]